METLEQAMNGTETGGFYRLLPSIGDLLLTPQFAILLESHSHDAIVRSVRSVLNRIKAEIAAGEHTHASLTQRLSSLDSDIAAKLVRSSGYSLKRVINATGVVLHTNLGRSPLSQAALDHMVATVYDEWRARSGRQNVSSILKCFSHRPDFLREVMSFSNTVHFSEGHLTRRVKEAIACWVSRLNHCPY